jgi:hypothetical protein
MAEQISRAAIALLSRETLRLNIADPGHRVLRASDKVPTCEEEEEEAIARCRASPAASLPYIRLAFSKVGGQSITLLPSTRIANILRKQKQFVHHFYQFFGFSPFPPHSPF